MQVGDVVILSNPDGESKRVTIKSIDLINSVEIPMVKQNKSLLSVAVKHGDMNIVESLLKAGVSPDDTVNIKGTYYNIDHITYLSWAIMNGNFEMMMLLLKYGADTNLVLPSRFHFIDTYDPYNEEEDAEDEIDGQNEEIEEYTSRHSLAAAIYWNHLDYVPHLLAYDANINYGVDTDVNIEFTPLAAAIYRGNFDAVTMLFENGLDISRSQQPYLAYVISIRHMPRILSLRMCKLLIEYCASVEHEYDGYDPLETAGIEGNKLVFRLLLALGALNYRNNKDIIKQLRIAIQFNDLISLEFIYDKLGVIDKDLSIKLFKLDMEETTKQWLIDHGADYIAYQTDQLRYAIVEDHWRSFKDAENALKAGANWRDPSILSIPQYLLGKYTKLFNKYK